MMRRQRVRRKRRASAGEINGPLLKQMSSQVAEYAFWYASTYRGKGRRLAFVADPDGNLLQFVNRPQPLGSEAPR
ncbi:MAG: hypothetical protein HY332_10925 [Chloroflexi bacterium]|nr:hypothetical protein [Chloroflexota bacterium]